MLRRLWRLGFRSARSLCSHASLHHIFSVAGTLRVPLSQPKKRHIQPERYVKLHLSFLKSVFTDSYKMHHIGYAVKDIEKSFKVFSLLNYVKESSIIEDFERNIKIQFIRNCKTRIELIQTLDKNKKSPVDFLFKGSFFFPGNGIPYHICYSVKDMDKAIEKLNKNERYIIIQPKSKAVALEGKNVAFLLQKDIGIIELLECKR
jgi:methylmalonyl-CoA/ethylmalonyl-CoA epimerase